MTTVAAAAAALRAARLARAPRRPFTDTDPALDEAWGYAVQDADRAARLAAGERIVGAKLGLTSRPKQITMGVHRPIAGFLTDAMPLSLAGTGQPRLEPEIAFRLGARLDRTLTERDALGVVDGVTVAVELIDSRYAGFAFRLPDVLADNTSAAGFRTGDWTTPRPDLADAACTFTVDGRIAHTATGSAILGHPVRALVRLSEHLARRGETLEAGAIVLAGALTDAVPVRSGTTYRAAIDGLGAIEGRL